MQVSQCSTSSWRAAGKLLAAIAAKKGSVNVGVGDGSVFQLQEWDDRDFANAPLAARNVHRPA